MRRRGLFTFVGGGVAAFLVGKYGRPDDEPVQVVRRWEAIMFVDGEKVLVGPITDISVPGYTLERQFTEPLFLAPTAASGRHAHES